MIAAAPASPAAASVIIPLTAGWDMASARDPECLARPERLQFIAASAPTTAAAVLREHGAWRRGDGIRFDEMNYLFRCRFEAMPAAPGEEVILRFGGIATESEAWLNGEPILESQSMFASHEVDVSALIRDRNELTIVCHSLTAGLRERRGRPPMARWRTRLVDQQQLRWFRTTLLGRAPGFSREPEPVGPWRPVSLVRRRIAVENWERKVELEGSRGRVAIQLRLRLLDIRSRPVAGRVVTGGTSTRLEWTDSGNRYEASAVVRIPDVVPWSPHTHGDPALYPLRLELQLADGEMAAFDDVPVGFRSIDPGFEQADDTSLALSVNGVPVFCRGVVWTPPDVVSLGTSAGTLRQRLRLLRDAGFNMVRLAGTTTYESDAFHRLCDELGLLVWQDMMFANMDYPFEDGKFHDTVRTEAEAELSRLSRHPSTAVICGNSEIEQQAAMFGLNPAVARSPFFYEELPRIAAGHCPGVPYIASSPTGGALPFHTRTGVAHYFGVGAYRRPIEEVRRAAVRFASECLAFANVPEAEIFAGAPPANDEKRGVPRDAGTDWDFADVRDHYLNLLYDVAPAALRERDPSWYWDLSRMVSGEVMAEVFGEWRRPRSGCRGGIVLWGADLEPGAGWGVLDSEGQPKAAYWFLKRALASRTLWTTDEGLNGIDIHVANDLPEPLDAWLRVALYRLGEHKTAEAESAISLTPWSAFTCGVEEILGRFVDAACAYRFGPPGHDLVVASLHARPSDVPFAQAFRFPAGRATVQPAPLSELSITAEAEIRPDGAIGILLRSKRLAWGVRVTAPGCVVDDACFGIEPSGSRCVVLRPIQAGDVPREAVLTAVNGSGSLPIVLRRGA